MSILSPIPKTSLTLDFTPFPLNQWRQEFAKLPRSNLLQSCDYARFMLATKGLQPRLGFIRDHDQTIGMVQIMTHGLLGGRIGAVILDRGPLWFCCDPPRDWVIDFFCAFNQHFPSGYLRRRRILPECRSGLLTEDDWRALKLRPVTTSENYQTIWLDLTLTSEKLRDNLNKKWRYDLRAAENENLPLPIFSAHARDANLILAQSSIDRVTRDYRSLPGSDLAKLVQLCASGDGIIIAQVIVKNEMLAGAIFLRHGSCATYQVGWVHPQGRKSRANHWLLWHALLYLKTCGITALDLGGCNDQDASGIAHFKQGLGGEHVTLAGHFC